jgi:hypothetical protein
VPAESTNAYTPTPISRPTAAETIAAVTVFPVGLIVFVAAESMLFSPPERKPVSAIELRRAVSLWDVILYVQQERRCTTLPGETGRPGLGRQVAPSSYPLAL